MTSAAIVIAIVSAGRGRQLVGLNRALFPTEPSRLSLEVATLGKYATGLRVVDADGRIVHEPTLPPR